MTHAPRKKISHIIVKAIRDHGGEIFNDDLAKRTKLTREQVRNSVRQLMRDHPEYGVVETSPYYYVYDSALTPAVGEYDPVAQYLTATKTMQACEFSVVTRKGDVVILADENDALWAAKKL